MVRRLSTQTELFGTLMPTDVDHVVYEQSMKNHMKRMNEYIKDRTEAFDDFSRAESQNLTMQRTGSKRSGSFIAMYSRTRKLVQRHYQMISCLNGLSQFC